MSSSSFFDPLGNDPKVGELSLITTLDVIPPLNPLTTTNSLLNNIEDPLDLTRALIMNSMYFVSETPIKFPNPNPLNIATTTYIMCWFRTNYPYIDDLISRWGEDLKYAFLNCDDRNDTDYKTVHKYNILLEYVYLLTKRYFYRTREYNILYRYVFECDNSVIKDIYFKFRQKYFDQYYNNLRNIQYDILFTNTTTTNLGLVNCGWLDIEQIIINQILVPFRNLNTSGSTYGVFLTNIENIIISLHDFLSSDGSFLQFILTTYVNFPQYGTNISKFDDKLTILYSYLTSIPDYYDIQPTYIPEVFSSIIGIPYFTSNYYSDEFVDWFSRAQNNRSIISSIIGLLYNLIIHLIDKFVRYQQLELPIPTLEPADGITFIGGMFLQYLTFYLTGSSVFGFEGLAKLYSLNNATTILDDSDIDYILGPPDDTGNRITGVLRYIIEKLRDFLTVPRVSSSILLRSDNDIGTPTYISFPAENKNSFYFGVYDGIDWLTQTMADSTVNIPSKFNLSFILLQKPENICINKLSQYKNITKPDVLENVILSLSSEDSLANCLRAIVATHLNIMEGLNIPTSNTYFTPTLTINSSNKITIYNNLILTNILETLTSTSSCPTSTLNIIFLSQFKFNNPNLINLKYYYIAIINYILFSICRQATFNDLELPSLNLEGLSFPFNDLIIYPFSNVQSAQYIYGPNNNDTIKLLYQTYIWHQLISISFFGTGKYFDPINLPDSQISIFPSWTSTGLIRNLFQLEWKYSKCLLDLFAKIVSDQALDKLGLLYLNGISVNQETVPIPYNRITNLERVTGVHPTNNKI